MRKSLFFLLFLFSIASCYAGTVRLINDSSFRLRAVIRGNDGSYLGELILNPQETSTWSDEYGTMGRTSKGGNYIGQFYRSVTPYTVVWYCIDGGDFSLCDNVPTGASVSAQACLGPRVCKPSKENPGSITPPPPENPYFERNSGPPGAQKGPP